MSIPKLSKKKSIHVPENILRTVPFKYTRHPGRQLKTNMKGCPSKENKYVVGCHLPEIASMGG